MSLNHLVAPQNSNGKLSVSVANLDAKYLSVDNISVNNVVVSNVIANETIKNQEIYQLGGAVNGVYNRLLTVQPSDNQIKTQINPFLFNGKYKEFVIQSGASTTVFDNSQPSYNNSSALIFPLVGAQYEYTASLTSTYPSHIADGLNLYFLFMPNSATITSPFTIPSFKLLGQLDFNITFGFFVDDIGRLCCSSNYQATYDASDNKTYVLHGSGLNVNITYESLNPNFRLAWNTLGTPSTTYKLNQSTLKCVFSPTL